MITFTNVPNGTYPFSMKNLDGYDISPQNGSITIDGSNMNQQIAFQRKPSIPFVKNDYSLNAGWQNFALTVLTNSSIGDIQTSDIASTRKISFTLECNWGTSACTLTIPNALLSGPYTLTVGGRAPLTSSTTVINETHTALYFTHSITGKQSAQLTGSIAVDLAPWTLLYTGLVFVGIIIGLILLLKWMMRPKEFAYADRDNETVVY